MMSRQARQSTLVKVSLPFFMALLVGIGSVAAQVGLSERQVGVDISEKLAEATASMLKIQKFDILSSKEVSKGRFLVDVEMLVQADERAIAQALARAQANKLSANWQQENNRVKRLAASAREKHNTSETIRATYELDRFGSWAIIEISDATSEYERLRNANGANSAPEEAQVLADFENMVKIVSNNAASITKFNIFAANKLPNNRVKLNIQMTLQGDGNAQRNVDFARRVNGITNSVEAIYQKDNRGNWVHVSE